MIYIDLENNPPSQDWIDRADIVTQELVDAADSVESCEAQPARSKAAITNGVTLTNLFITCLSIVGLAQQ